MRTELFCAHAGSTLRTSSACTCKILVTLPLSQTVTVEGTKLSQSQSLGRPSWDYYYEYLLLHVIGI